MASNGTAAGSDALKRASGLRVKRQSNTATGLLAVTYSATSVSGSRSSAALAREQAAGGTLVHQLSFDKLGSVIHVLSVPAAQMSTVAAQLRTAAGVQSVAATGLRRYSTAVTTQDFTNDPYFDGFTVTQNSEAGNPTPTTQFVGPYEESATVPGQWDMHAIGLEWAFGYSQAGNNNGAWPPTPARSVRRA